MNFDYIELEFLSLLGSVSSDDISDGLSAQWAFPSLRPLMHSALEAHAHVSTGVEDTVHLTLTADDTLGGGQAVTGAGGGPAGRLGGGVGFNAKNLNLLSGSKNINERSGVEGDVSVEQNPLGSSIDGAEDSPVQGDSEGDLVPILGVRQHVLGADPVLGPLAQDVRVLGELTALQEPRVS